MPLIRAQKSEAPARSSRLGGLPMLRAAPFEMPADQIPGQYRRVSYALAFRSDAPRSWLNGMGVAARSCMHTKRSSSGEWSGAVFLFARCTRQRVLAF